MVHQNALCCLGLMVVCDVEVWVAQARYCLRYCTSIVVGCSADGDVNLLSEQTRRLLYECTKECLSNDNR